MSQIVLQDSDLHRIALLSGPDFARLYQVITDRLRAVKILETPNQNVISVRLSPGTFDHVKRLALRFGTNRSGVVREAVQEFVRRNPI